MVVWDLLLLPQQLNLWWLLIAHVWSAPADTLITLINCSFGISVWLYSLLPKHYSVKDWVI